ncbi:hypothetical protein TRFO_22287 [Tritrichomonas foetus]|uniref:Uncharacterized protein n=1 Tax=Tritrichomonas foetus TaxID=1144522 RepID=A0A1J4KGM8_9EUKA|nr:hypothetical protein TRFO_22287 [Tritrichomonas foetus]|eukprot:OHT08956.1 hypothetical protein TRFO_22287 [Tritrichomonas foetus]
MKSQNEIICSSKQIQKQIKIISSIQDISNQISILSQVDVSKFTTSEQLSEHQEELDNLIEERNKLLEFLNTERKHIEESRHFEEDIKLFEQITLNNEIKFVFHYEEEQSSKEIHRLHELIRETQRTKLNDEYSQENISRKNEQINMKKIKIRRGIIKVCIASEEHNHRLKRGEKYNQYLFDYVTTYPNKNIKLDIYDEQQATLDIEDPTPQLFDPTQLHAEFYQDDKWLKASDYQLGSLGESLFNFLKQNVDIPEYVEPFAIETNRILRKTMSKIDPKDIQNNSHYFTNAHKLFSLICESPKKFPYRKFQKNFELTIGELFALLVKRITAIVKEDFFICVNQGLRCFDAEIAVTRIVQAQCSICAPLNTIIWQHVLRTVDCKLANYIIDDKGIPDFEIMMKVYDVIKELEKILNIKMPYSDQAYSLIKNYPKIIQDSTPFEVAAPNLPPDFVVGLIFTGKKKNMIPFEISDDRIIKFADYLRLDISKAINYKLKIDESKTNLPSTLWLVPKKK